MKWIEIKPIPKKSFKSTLPSYGDVRLHIYLLLSNISFKYLGSQMKTLSICRWCYLQECFNWDSWVAFEGHVSPNI